VVEAEAGALAKFAAVMQIVIMEQLGAILLVLVEEGEPKQLVALAARHGQELLQEDHQELWVRAVKVVMVRAGIRRKRYIMANLLL